jgi:aldose 1-epimerase
LVLPIRDLVPILPVCVPSATDRPNKKIMKRNAVSASIRPFVIAAILVCGMNVAAEPNITKASFGKTAGGKGVAIYTLTNSRGAEAKIITYGGAVVSLKVPDKNGKLADVVLGFDSVTDYEKHMSYIGALIGRYANRIAKGKFTLSGGQYTLATNNGENHLHGGPKGYDKVIWKARPFIDAGGAHLELTYLSKNGEEGYPGNLKVSVIYALTEQNELKIEYSAVTDKETIVNLTHHSYFNLAGAGNGDILAHQLTINADRFTPTDGGSIPYGELRSVAGTPFDFTKASEIGSRIGQPDEQLKFGSGYDHNWVLNKAGNELSLAASVYEGTSGRVMDVFTTEPGLQFYSGNFLDGAIAGKGGKKYPRRSGFCLEAQHFPDSPNQAAFPTTTLKPGQTYKQTTIYKFSTR